MLIMSYEKFTALVKEEVLRLSQLDVDNRRIEQLAGMCALHTIQTYPDIFNDIMGPEPHCIVTPVAAQASLYAEGFPVHMAELFKVLIPDGETYLKTHTDQLQTNPHELMDKAIASINGLLETFKKAWLPKHEPPLPTNYLELAMLIDELDDTALCFDIPVSERTRAYEKKIKHKYDEIEAQRHGHLNIYS